MTEESPSDIFESIAELDAIQAINRGQPEKMGWDAKTFRLKSSKADGKGRVVENKCLGCDSYFEEVLGAQLRELREKRLSSKVKIEA